MNADSDVKELAVSVALGKGASQSSIWTHPAPGDKKTVEGGREREGEKGEGQDEKEE